MASIPKAKARFAFVFLTLCAVSLFIVLATCLPSKPEASRARPQRPSAGASEVQPQAPAEVGVTRHEPERLSAQPSLPAAPPQRPAPEKGGRMAVIIDDAGYKLEDLQPFLDFPPPVTIAVLPNLANSGEAARRVLAAGKGLLLHCPMEPRNGEDPGPGALRTDQTDAEIEGLLAAAFRSVPGAEGLNNHMGSRATADERLMTDVMAYLKKEGKLFVDSRTTADSVAERIAAGFGVPFLQRDVFIDNERDAADIERAIAAGVERARTGGSAILIGHVHTPEILAILKRDLSKLQESGVRLVSLPEILGSE